MNEAAATTATASATDAELVDAVRAGDEHAFAELYRRYRPRVCAFVRRRVRDDGRAEDLTQEAFLSALRRLRETEARVSFRPWIYEIARNATIDQFRRSARTDEVSVDGRLHASDHLRLLSPYGPDREVAAKQDLETLQGAFDELSDRHERILVMRELEGLSYREIGRRMELTRPGVESTLFRARRRLQSEFTELETGRRCLTVRGAMGRLVEGMNVRTDRGLVKRHVRRCAVCRADARELGLVPERASRASRVAALLPLPFVPGAFSAKAAAVVAAVALTGGGVGIGALSSAGGSGQQLSVEPASTVHDERSPGQRVRPAPTPSSAAASVPRAPVAEVATSRLRVAPPSGPREEPPAAVAPRIIPQEPAVPVVATPRAEVPEVVNDGGPAAPVLESLPPAVVENGANTLREVLRTPGPMLPGVPGVPPGA